MNSTADSEDHQHSYQLSAWQKGDAVSFSCQCGEQFSRAMDAEELARYEAKINPAPADDVHHVWHELQLALPDGWADECSQEGKIQIMDVIEEFATKYPDQVLISGCDDTYFSTSQLVLVTHEARDAFMGTTVLLITQCDEQPPAQFFLYPGHADGMADALGIIQARANAKKVPMKAVPGISEDRRDAAQRDWWNSRALLQPIISSEGE